MNFPDAKDITCPHCLRAIHIEIGRNWAGRDPEVGEMHVKFGRCPSCGKNIVWLTASEMDEVLVYPKSSARSPVPKQVPKDIADEYKEACLVLPDSPKASAALSRRCLQNILRSAGQVKESNLEREIEEVLPKLPPHLSKSIDAVRVIGNFMAHPSKSKHTGEIIDVEPGEAEWQLETIEALFDFYYVQPAIIAEKRENLDKKLGDIGKPPLK